VPLYNLQVSSLIIPCTELAWDKKNVLASCSDIAKMCFPENIYTPLTEGIGISWGIEGSTRPKNLKKPLKLNWDFQSGWEVLEKIPSVGRVWIFSGTTQ